MARKIIKAILSAEDRASPKFARVGNAVAALGAISAAVGAVQIGRFLVHGLEAAVAASGKQEAAEKKLAQSIRNTGASASAVLPRLKAQAEALQDLTGVGDELILSQQSLLVSVGRLSGEGLERATKAALDMAGQTGNVQQAFDLVAKAAAGYTGTLSRYGIIIDQSLPQSEKFAAALSKIEELFGGQAAARLKTFEGRLEELQGRFGDLQETIGGPFREVITEVLGTALSPLVKSIDDSIGKSTVFRDTVIEVAISLARFVQAVEPAVVGLSKFVVLAGAIKGKEFLRNLELLGAGFQSLGLAPVNSKLDELIGNLERLKASGPAAIDDGGLSGAFVGPLTAVEQLNEALTGLQVAPVRDLALEGQKVADAFGLLLGAQDSLTPEQFEKIEEALRGSAESVTGEGGLVPGLELVAVKAEESFLRAGEAAQLWADGGLAAVDDRLKELETDSLEPLGLEIDRVFRGQAINAAVSFGDALVDAAQTGRLELDKLFKKLAIDMARALIQALVLRAALSFLNLSGGGVTSSGSTTTGGGVISPNVELTSAQHGILTGGTPGKDSILVNAMPGEAFLPRGLTDLLLNAARVAGPAGVRDNRSSAAGGSAGITIERLELKDVDAFSFRRLVRRSPEAIAEGLRAALERGTL